MADLTPEQIRLEQERLELIQKQNAAAKELASTYEKMAKSKTKLNDDEKELFSLTKQLSVFAQQIENTAQKRISSTSTVKELSKSIKELEADITKNQALYGDYVAKINSQKQKALTEFTSLAKKERDIQSEIKHQLEYQDEIQSVIERLKYSTNEADKRALIAAKEALRENNTTLNILEKNLDKVIKQKETQKDIFKQLKAAKESYEKITEEQQKELDLSREKLKEKKKEETLDVLKTKLLGDNLKTIKEMFTLGSIIDMLFKGSDNIANFRKELGMSYGHAYELNNQLSFVGSNISDAYITGEKLKKSFADLSKEMGFVADYGTESLVTMTNLTGKLGMANKEAAQLTTLARFQSKDTEKVLDGVGKTVSSMNKQKGTAILLKDVMKEISNVSMATAVSLGKNPQAIAEAVVAAKQLGSSLEQMEKTADHLLNFENSIESELKAELLTGKQLNLERARAAALSNDMKTLSEEIGKNQDVINSFAKGNRLEQQAIAESLGMSREELAKMVYQQEAQKIGAEGVRAKYGEQAYEQLKAQNAQEKFTNAVEKLKAALSGVVQIFSPILDALATVGEFVSVIVSKWYILYPILIGAALLYIPKMAKGFANMWDNVKGMATDAMKLFKKGGLTDLMGKGKETPTPSPAAPDTKGGGAGGGMLDKLKGIKTSDMIKGAAAILILSAALFVAAKAFQEFATVKWEDVGKGIVGLASLAGIAMMLGKATSSMIKGAVTVAILGVALIPFAYAMSLIAGLSWESVGAAVVALIAFGAAVFALGAIMFSGVGALIFGAGILALIALGGAMIILGYGLKAVSEGGQGVTELFKSLSELDITKLNAVAPALAMIGAAVLKLGAGSLLAGIGGKLGGGPVAIIQGIANAGDGLQKAATGLQGVAGALTQVSAALASIDISKLEALEGFATKMTVGSVVKGITDFITAPIKAVGSMVEGAAGGDNKNDAMVKAINEVRDEVKKLYNKDSTINMDGKKVGTTLTQSSTKLA